MEYIIFLVINIIAIVVIKIGLGIKINSVKKVKEIGFDSSLNELTNQFPKNKEVCKQILKQLNNENVEIEESLNENGDASFYFVVTNKIIIANIKNTFTRIQTIAHECLHSIQNRKTLLFNFIFSNIYLIYFGLISILTIAKIIKTPMLFLIILTILGIIYYVIRAILETEAMSKAPYVAKEYMENSNLASKEDIDIIIENYHNLNKIGIPLINFNLIAGVLIKNIIYCVIVMIMI